MPQIGYTGTIGIIIQARTGSSRLPEKVVLPFYDGKNIVDILVEKLKPLNLPIVVATSDSERDLVLKNVAEKKGAYFFRGSERDALKRFIDASDFFKIDVVIRVCADNPFIHAPYLQALVDSFRAKPADYVSYATAAGKPAILTHYGFFGELVTVETLKKVAGKNLDEASKEHVTSYIYHFPKEFDIRWIEFPFKEPKNRMRFTVDTADDFKLLSRLFAKYHELSPSALIGAVMHDEDVIRAMEQRIISNAK